MGVEEEEESQVPVLGTVLCEGTTRNVWQSRVLFFFSLSPVVCPCSLVGVGTLLVRVPGMDGVGGTTESRAAPGRTGEKRLPVLGWQPGGRASLCGSWPAGVPCALCFAGGVCVGILGLASAQQGLIWIKPARPS